jgi:hypothetical protein
MPANSYGGSPPPLSDLNAWFDYYDRDRSGYLSKDEVTKAMIQTFAIKSVPSFVVKQAVSQVWKNFDRNNDGQIDRQEFTKVGGVGSKLLSLMGKKPKGTTGQNLHASAPPQQQPYASMQTPQQQYGMYPPQAPMQTQHQYPMPPQQYAAPPMAPTLVAQQPQYQTMRATIPPGMTAGQPLNINTPNGMFTVVIPDRSQWTNAHTGQPSFDCMIPSSAPAVQAQRW